MINKKAQMEIMGLAIVVVLLVLGMLFTVKFVLFKPQETYRKDYINTQLTANMLNTLLNTNTLCKDISIAELLQDASKANPNIGCQSLDSKEYVNAEINKLLNTTVQDMWKKDFFFKASTTSGTIVSVGQEYSYRERERKTHFLQTDAGVMTIILDIYG